MRLYADSEICRLIYYRHFESVERAFLNSFLQPGDVFVDVGANIGLFTLIAANRVGSTGQVIAFEPTAVTYRRLLHNVQINRFKQVKCLQLALSDGDGALELMQSVDGFDAWNSLARPTMGKAFTSERVHAVGWDQYAKQQDLIGSVTMMKIDVEGWETRVLSGGQEMFARSDAPVLQVEFSDEAASGAGVSCHILYRTLEGFGYRMFIYKPEICAIVPDSMREEYPYVNLIAAKNPDFVNARLRAGH
jgi:FkbM family methyltransferase